MKSFKFLCVLLVAGINLTNISFSYSYELHSPETTSIIKVVEVNEDLFEIQYCKDYQYQCLNLGRKQKYTFEELQSLMASEKMKTITTGVTSVVSILAGAWLGYIGGGIYGLTLLSGREAIQAAAAAGSIGSATITGRGITWIDKINPFKHHEIVTFVSKIETNETEYFNDVDAQAFWIQTRLDLIP